MKGFTVFFSCFVSLYLVVASAAQARNNGVYIVYTGAAISSSTGLDESNHILSSSSMESWKDRVIHRYSNGFSGFSALLSEEEAKSIAQRPEVVSVFPDRVLHLHTTRSWDFLKELSGAVGSKPRLNPKTSSSLSDQDVIIGILDTGIWPEAKSFNDKDMSPIPKKWKGKCEEGLDFKASNCNRKLIGARNYMSFDNSTSARDYAGHGTHVAGIAAGRPVYGASYNGIARGTARGGSPDSRIAVYRTCNDEKCDGSAVLKAFDDAIADGVDIISMSFGYISSESTDDYAMDPVAIGSFHAAEAGILVVGSGGDSAIDANIPWVQNAFPWILTVGASTIDRFFQSDVVLGGNKIIKAGGVHFAKMRKNPVYPLIDGGSAKDPDARDDEARNCLPHTLDASKVKGKIVVCETYHDGNGKFGKGGRHEVVVNLGGIGVIAIDSHDQLVNSVYGSSPMVVVERQVEDEILSYINSTRNPVATILPTVAVANYKPAPSVAYFSGRGPALTDETLIKPDVVAPGVDILSAWPSNASDTAFNIMSGTSMACPHVSGIAASVKSRYPSWSPSAIKSAIMTTASQKNNLNERIRHRISGAASPDDIGAGEVTSLGPLQPGLVYETETADYLRLLCNIGYNETKIKLISRNLPANFSCPSSFNDALVSDMNYPSIYTSDIKSTRVARTVTNVGEEEDSVYAASVEISDKNIKVQVQPSKLHFTKEKKKLTYQVTFSINNQTADLREASGFGSITWSNDKYNVRIPVIAYLLP